MFLDERGAGLRVTWHPERDLVVLSVWHDESCVGTFRMSVQDVPRLSGLLAAALGDWVDQSGGAVPLGMGGSGARDRGRAGGRGWWGQPFGAAAAQAQPAGAQIAGTSAPAAPGYLSATPTRANGHHPRCCLRPEATLTPAPPHLRDRPRSAARQQGRGS